MDMSTKNRLELWLEIEDAKRRLVEQKSFYELCKTENDKIGDRQAAVIRAFSRFAQSFISGDMHADVLRQLPTANKLSSYGVKRRRVLHRLSQTKS
jgi:hypothetical protein